MIILKIIQYVRNGKIVTYLKEASLRKEGAYLIIDLENKIYYIINNKKHIPIESYNELMDYLDERGMTLI